MWQFFEDYFGTKANSRSSGVLFTFPGRIDEGKEEVRRIARKCKVKMKMHEKQIYGRDVHIHWQCTGTRDSVRMFNNMLSVSGCFRMIDLKSERKEAVEDSSGAS